MALGDGEFDWKGKFESITRGRKSLHGMATFEKKIFCLIFRIDWQLFPARPIRSVTCLNVLAKHW